MPDNSYQIALQRRAAHVITEDLLDQASREGLPMLTWSIGDVGAQIAGVSYAHPSSKRRDEITAWAKALNIELSEHASDTAVTIMGIAKQAQTSFGFATIMLICDVYSDEDQAAAADRSERHYAIPVAGGTVRP